jgi:hypothetical protein
MRAPVASKNRRFASAKISEFGVVEEHDLDARNVGESNDEYSFPSSS